MNNLLLLGGVIAGYMYFKTPAKPSTKKAIPKTEKPVELPPKNGKLVAGSKENGYEIYDCTHLIISDVQKAYEYAYSLGENIKEYTGQFDDLLFGPCFVDPNDVEGVKKLLNTKEKAKFVFDLFKFAFSGYVANHLDQEEEILENLQTFKTKMNQLLGINTSDFEVEIIIKGEPPVKLDNGFTIKACETLSITDPSKFANFMNSVLEHNITYGEFKETDPTAPFEYAKKVLKDVSPDCYNGVATNTFNKNSFIISYMFIFSAYMYYITTKFVNALNWKNFFELEEEFEQYMVEATNVFETWFTPLFLKFELDAEKMTKILEGIEKTGKYPF